MNTVRVTRRRLRYEAKAAPRLIREISQRIALPLNLNFFCKDLLSGLMSDVGCKAGSVLRRGSTAGTAGSRHEETCGSRRQLEISMRSAIYM